MKCPVYDLNEYRKRKQATDNQTVRRLILLKLEYERRSMVYNQIRENDERLDYI